MKKDEKEEIDLIICADTIVVVELEKQNYHEMKENFSPLIKQFNDTNNEWLILEKPKSPQHAFEILKLLSAFQQNTVITSVCLLLPKIKHHRNDEHNNGGDDDDKEEMCFYKLFSESTRVHFSKLSDEEIQTYVNTNEPMYLLLLLLSFF